MRPLLAQLLELTASAAMRTPFTWSECKTWHPHPSAEIEPATKHRKSPTANSSRKGTTSISVAAWAAMPIAGPEE